MPTYQYRCNECNHEFSEFQSITADPLSTCPECSGTLQRLISGGAGFLFKGDGFYITDYRSENYKKAEKADKESSSSKTDGSKSEGGGSSDSSGAKEKGKSDSSSKADSSSGQGTSD
tara:strand:+ start:82 stop:432 length:351 start_codon:yes stop_codon:yes gene_type:complete